MDGNHAIPSAIGPMEKESLEMIFLFFLSSSRNDILHMSYPELFLELEKAIP